MGRLQCTVAHWPKADMTVRDSDVRFRGQSGHPLGLDEYLLMTQLRHRQYPIECASLGVEAEGQHTLQIRFSSVDTIF